MKTAFPIFVMFIVWGILFMVLISSRSINNPLKSKIEKVKPFFGILIPQGWSFFTRNPKEERYYLYIKNPSGNWILDRETNNFSLSNLGIRRGGRSKMMQLTTLFKHLDKNDWIEFEDIDLEYYLNKNTKIKTLKSSILSNHVYNDYKIVATILPPWSWRNFKNTGTIGRIAYIRIIK